MAKYEIVKILLYSIHQVLALCSRLCNPIERILIVLWRVYFRNIYGF